MTGAGARGAAAGSGEGPNVGFGFRDPEEKATSRYGAVCWALVV